MKFDQDLCLEPVLLTQPLGTLCILAMFHLQVLSKVRFTYTSTFPVPEFSTFNSVFLSEVHLLAVEIL